MDRSIQILKNYFRYSGRASRKEYWLFVLYNVIFLTVVITIDFSITPVYDQYMWAFFYILYSIFILILGLAFTVRRLHDVGLSAWTLLVALIPILGEIWLLMYLIRNSIPGENKYGANPIGINENKLENQSTNETIQNSKTVQSNKNPYSKWIVIIVVILGLTLPFHYVPSALMVFPKNNLSFSYTIITQSDIDDIVTRYNNASFLEREAMNNEPIVRKLMEKGLIYEKK